MPGKCIKNLTSFMHRTTGTVAKVNRLHLPCTKKMRTNLMRTAMVNLNLIKDEHGQAKLSK